MSSPQSRIAQLSAIISDYTTKIDTFLANNRLPHPSFEANAPASLGLPPDLEEARLVVLQATQELNDLLQGPRDIIMNHQVHPQPSSLQIHPSYPNAHGSTILLFI
jgi:hypothetical protein